MMDQSRAAGRTHWLWGRRSRRWTGLSGHGGGKGGLRLGTAAAMIGGAVLVCGVLSVLAVVLCDAIDGHDWMGYGVMGEKSGCGVIGGVGVGVGRQCKHGVFASFVSVTGEATRNEKVGDGESEPEVDGVGEDAGKGKTSSGDSALQALLGDVMGGVDIDVDDGDGDASSKSDSDASLGVLDSDVPAVTPALFAAIISHTPSIPTLEEAASPPRPLRLAETEAIHPTIIVHASPPPISTSSFSDPPSPSTPPPAGSPSTSPPSSNSRVPAIDAEAEAEAEAGTPPSRLLECFQIHAPVCTAEGWNVEAVRGDGGRRGRGGNGRIVGGGDAAAKEEVAQMLDVDFGGGVTSDGGYEEGLYSADVHVAAGRDAGAVADGTKKCEMLLMEHSFGWSYGKPFVGSYNPPPCAFNHVILKLTITSAGRQFDRLATLSLTSTEIFRTSTAEPTPSGITWTYTKDSTQFLSLWKSPQKVIFDLGNLISDTYTGRFNTTLTATFFLSPTYLDPADLILPLSALRAPQNLSSSFILPSATALTTLTPPRNANRALISILATGQAAEEFWWSNVPPAYTSTFPDIGALGGFGPFRGAEVWIDGCLAGWVDAFPVVFTGGVAPGLWRPLVGMQAFDLRAGTVDVSAWLGELSDGKAHAFELRVVGLGGVETAGNGGRVTNGVGENWVVSAQLHFWLDHNFPDAITKGNTPVVVTGEEVVQRQWLGLDCESDGGDCRDGGGKNKTLKYETRVKRTLDIVAVVESVAGKREVSWSQKTKFSHVSTFEDFGRTQVVWMKGEGWEESTERRASSYSTPSSFSADLPSPEQVFEPPPHEAEDPKSTTSPTHHTSLHHSHTLLVSTTMDFDPHDSASNLTIDASLSLSAAEELQSLDLTAEEEGASDEGRKAGLRERIEVVRTRLAGTGYYFSSPGTKTGVSFGRTRQGFLSGVVGAGGGGGGGSDGDEEIDLDIDWSDWDEGGAMTGCEKGNIYSRYVDAVNGSVAVDREVLNGRTKAFEGAVIDSRGSDSIQEKNKEEEEFVHFSARKLLGRGPV